MKSAAPARTIVLAFAVAACSGSYIQAPAAQPAPTNVVVVEPDINAVAPATVVIEKAERWKQAKTDPKPDAGNVYVAVLLKITAVDDADYSPYYAKLRDGQGFEYDWQIIPRKERSLGSGELAPGAAVRGWITFEVPKASVGNLTLVWDSLFGEQILLPVKLAA